MTRRQSECFRNLDDPALQRLIGMIQLTVDEKMTQAYPGQQGGEVEVTDSDGNVHTSRLDDVVIASADEVRQRFRIETAKVLGAEQTQKIENCIDDIEHADNAAELARLLAANDGTSKG